MEAGYSTIDDESLSVKKDQKLMLFRFPKDFNIEDLNGKTIDISENNFKAVNIESGSRKKYSLKRDATAVHMNIRPILRNDIDGSTTIGDAFSGVYNITETVDLKTLTQSSKLPIRPAYVDVEQVDFLRVHSVPIGSTSKVDPITGEIIPGKTMTKLVAGAETKKRKEVPSSSSVSHVNHTTENNLADGGSHSVEKEKKHKKKNKEHKEKKDKK